jgi:VanZ family protein
MRSRAIDAILWMLAAFLLLAIVILSVIPVNQAGSLADPASVQEGAVGVSMSSVAHGAVWHSAFYGPLTLTLLLAVAWRPGLPRRRSRRPALLVILGVGSLGLLLEIVQLGVVGRSADLLDLVGDAVGLIVGVAIWLVIERLSQDSSNRHERFRSGHAHRRAAVSGEGIDPLD